MLRLEAPKPPMEDENQYKIRKNCIIIQVKKAILCRVLTVGVGVGNSKRNIRSQQSRQKKCGSPALLIMDCFFLPFSNPVEGPF